GFDPGGEGRIDDPVALLRREEQPEGRRLELDRVEEGLLARHLPSGGLRSGRRGKNESDRADRERRRGGGDEEAPAPRARTRGLEDPRPERRRNRRRRPPAQKGVGAAKALQFLATRGALSGVRLRLPRASRRELAVEEGAPIVGGEVRAHGNLRLRG